MREEFWNKVTEEYQRYKTAILFAGKEEIYGKSYEIEMMVNMYEVLMEIGEKLSEGVLAALLLQTDILASFYQKWMEKEDDLYKQIEHHVTEEIMRITAAQSKKNGRRIGYEADKAA